jgi:hypothetical protein
MFYILDKLGRVIGSADGSVNTEDLASRGEVAVSSELILPIDEVDVAGNAANPTLVKRQVVNAPKIVLNTSAKDTDGDGFPELPADGKSKAEITATLYDALGTVVDEQVEVTFRTSAGVLFARWVNTKKGEAKVTLTAGNETVMASVSASAEGFEPASIEFEFLPVTPAKQEPAKTTKK